MRSLRQERYQGFSGTLCILRDGVTLGFANAGRYPGQFGLICLPYDCLFGLPLKGKEDRLRHLSWVHAVYTLQNSCRSAGAPPQKKELFDFMDRLLCRVSHSKGPISRVSRDCISKRKAERTQLRSDSRIGPSRRRIGDSQNSSQERPFDLPRGGTIRPRPDVSGTDSLTDLPHDRAVRPRCS